MGVPSVYIPTEPIWQNLAPTWARPHWNSVYVQLAVWCTSHGLPLHADSASIFVK
jgi:hypothetical protein